MSLTINQSIDRPSSPHADSIRQDLKAALRNHVGIKQLALIRHERRVNRIRATQLRFAIDCLAGAILGSVAPIAVIYAMLVLR